MRHSLLSRFQGALLGCAFGEALGDDYLQPSVWGATIRSIAEGLVSCGTWSEEMLPQVPDSPAPPLSSAKGVFTATASTKIAELAILTLPLSLFFHEDDLKLWRNLNQVVWAWRGHSTDASGVAAVGYAIALSLREQLEPLQAIPAVATYLQRYQADSTNGSVLINRLEQVQQLLYDRADLRSALSQLLPAETSVPVSTGAMSAADVSAITPLGNCEAIAIAFYCFLSTPDHLRLSVMRAARCPFYPRLIGALTGAMSGVYNGVAAMPLSWSLGKSPTRYLRHGSLSETDCELGARLLAAWSGASHPASFSSGATAIAAPDVIRPR